MWPRADRAVLGVERFLSEIKTTAKRQRPHILPLLDSRDAGGLLFYVMPFRMPTTTYIPTAPGFSCSAQPGAAS